MLFEEVFERVMGRKPTRDELCDVKYKMFCESQGELPTEATIEKAICALHS